MKKKPRKNLTLFQEKIGVVFHDEELLKKALTHKSWSNEFGKREHNERLEFLGDSVLSLVITTCLYKKFTKEREGVLSKWKAAIVSEPPLAEVARDLGLGELLYFGKGEEGSGGRERDSNLANAMEALTGAIFLDQGLEVADGFLLRSLRGVMDEVIRKKSFFDYKTKLQEYAYQYHKKTPVYSLISSQGPDHKKKFNVAVGLGSYGSFQGEGTTIKKAEQRAAQACLETIQNLPASE